VTSIAILLVVLMNRMWR